MPPRAGSSSDCPLFRPLRRWRSGRGKTDQESRASGRSPKTHRPCAGSDRATQGESPLVGIPRVDCSTQSPAGMNRPPARAPGLVVQGDAERAHLPGVAPEGSRVPTPRSGGGSDRIGSTCREHRLELDPCRPERAFDRAMSGQSVGSRSSSASPHRGRSPRSRVFHPGSLRYGTRVTARGLRPAPPRRGLPEREGYRFPGPNRGHRLRESGAAAVEGRSNRPCLLRDRGNVTAHETPTYGGRTSGRAKTP